MLVLGLVPGQNLFITGDNAWDKNAYVRRYPFCMTRVSLNGKEAPERVVCVEKRSVTPKGERLFADDSEALPAWAPLQTLLFEYEADLLRAQQTCTLLAQHALFEPFTMQAVPAQGEPLQLTGMYRVIESRLAELDADVLSELVRTGVLGRVYTHLLSLENFQRLLLRAAPEHESRRAAKNEPALAAT